MPRVTGEQGGPSGFDASGFNVGVWGDSFDGNGVVGSSNQAPGIQAHSFNNEALLAFSQSGNHGVRAVSRSASGLNFPPRIFAGVWGDSFDDTGVLGTSAGGGGGVSGLSQTSNGVQGESSRSNGVFGLSFRRVGVLGISNPDPDTREGGNAPGVLGRCVTPPGGGGGNGQGVFGSSTNRAGVEGTSTNSTGVLGNVLSSTGVTGTSRAGNGVFGFSTDANGVVGTSINGRAGLFNGPVRVTGFLDKAGGGFRIDHPLDPENKYFCHSFVESDEMKNVYDGVAHLDEDGSAWVELPEWFEQINRDFRYQLTAIGGPAPELHVAEEISGNRFKIAGGKEGIKVSWQITGIRKDRWAEANPIEVEQEKPEEERGLYLHPELYDQPEERGIYWRIREEQLRQAEVETELDLDGLEEAHREELAEFSRQIEEQRQRMEGQEEEPPEAT